MVKRARKETVPNDMCGKMVAEKKRKNVDDMMSIKEVKESIGN